MAESKYGRLFTEADARELARSAFSLGVHGAVAIEPGKDVMDVVWPQLLELHSTRFPADEPLFLLRGQDVYAGWAVQAYYDGVAEGRLTPAEMVGGLVHQEFADAVWRAWQAMLGWQLAHRDRMKVPD